MLKPLPPRPNLQQFRKQAKELLKAHRRGNPEAISRLQAFLPRLQGASEAAVRAADVPLHEAQWAIAREHGFGSWPRFKRYLESRPSPPSAPEARPERFFDVAAMSRSELAYYEGRVASLLRGHQEQDPDAISQLKWHLPGYRQRPTLEIINAEITEQDARWVIAQCYQFEDWEDLTTSLETARDEGRLHPLFDAAVDAVVSGNEAALRALLDEDPSLAKARCWHPHHGNLLHYVAANGVEMELQKTPPNAVEIARLLLAAGVDPNDECDIYGGGSGSTPLVGLVSSAHPAEAGLMEELVRAFCEGGALPDGVEGTGHPLATALAFYYPQAVRALVACGARVDNLLFAAAAGRLDLVEAYVDDAGRMRPDAPGLEVQWCRLSDDPRVAAEQALAAAALCGQTEVAGWLIDRGVDLDAGPRSGETPLHYAAWANQRQMAELLLARGANPNLPDGRFHAAAWGWAGHHGHAELRDFILETASETHLFAAVAAGRLERVEALLRAHPEQVNEWTFWTTPLDLAAGQGRVDLIQALLAAGANPNLPARDDGRTPLARALLKGHAEAAEVLRAAGAPEETS